MNSMAINKYKTGLIITGFITIAALAGCVYDKKEVVTIPCNIPASVTYARQVQPILSTNCYRCHSTASNIAGILLDNYANLKVYAQNGKLYGVITHASGFRPMPDDGGKIDDCSIATIKAWIDAGTPEN